MGSQPKAHLVNSGTPSVCLPAEHERDARSGVGVAVAAWVFAALYYFYQYALRSAPSVMMPELSDAFGLKTAGVASIVGLFYYGYSPFSLVAGVGMDRLGARRVLPVAAAAVGIGALLFASGNTAAGSLGRFLQGAGGVFALVGAISIASTYFSPSRAATLIGATQMFGMAGGAAGQFVIGPLISKGIAWDSLWKVMGIIGLLIAVLLFVLLPRDNVPQRADVDSGVLHSLFIVFRNPQSILCGLIAGLLFIPTTIFDMVWGVRYLQDAHGMYYASAVLRASTVPLGWMIGCPLLGFISDRIGRRKPVIIGGAVLLLACMACILFAPTGIFPKYTLGLMAGLASGSAMLPYAVIKEANPARFGGIATGVINFLNFTFSALLGPVFGWMLQRASGESGGLRLEHFQVAFAPLLLGVAVAIALTTFLRETGPSAWRPRIVLTRRSP